MEPLPVFPLCHVFSPLLFSNFPYRPFRPGSGSRCSLRAVRKSEAGTASHPWAAPSSIRRGIIITEVGGKIQRGNGKFRGLTFFLFGFKIMVSKNSKSCICTKKSPSEVSSSGELFRLVAWFDKFELIFLQSILSQQFHTPNVISQY